MDGPHDAEEFSPCCCPELTSIFSWTSWLQGRMVCHHPQRGPTWGDSLWTPSTPQWQVPRWISQSRLAGNRTLGGKRTERGLLKPDVWKARRTNLSLIVKLEIPISGTAIQIQQQALQLDQVPDSWPCNLESGWAAHYGRLEMPFEALCQHLVQNQFTSDAFQGDSESHLFQWNTNIWETWPVIEGHNFKEDWDKEGHINHPKRSETALTTDDIHQLQQDTRAHNELRATMNPFMERQFAKQEPLRNNLLIPADAVAKRYRPWPKGLRADSLPWFDSPLVQGASRLRYTDKAQVAATGPYWPKGARNKKKETIYWFRHWKLESTKLPSSEGILHKWLIPSRATSQSGTQIKLWSSSSFAVRATWMYTFKMKR